MKSLTRVFIITLTFTVTNKFDKDVQARGELLGLGLDGPFIRPKKSSSLFATLDNTSDDFIRSS